MKSILDTIIKVEDESKTIVEEAQKKAREIKEKAERENAARLDAARKETASSLMTSTNKAKKEWEEKIQHTLSSQDTLYSEFLNSKSNEIEQTVDKILARIKTPQHKNLNE